MRVGVVIAAVLAAVAGVAFYLRTPPPPTAPPPILKLEAGSVSLHVAQRTSTKVPGSGGRLQVHLGDITRGRVPLSLTLDGAPVPLPGKFARAGDFLPFSIGGWHYRLRVVELRNKLIGEDTATITISQRGNGIERIEALLAAIEASGLLFLRNGKAHSGAGAAQHLRRKWGHAGDRVRTPEDFIEHLASRSSLTGRAYRVRRADDSLVEMGVWLRKRLDELG